MIDGQGREQSGEALPALPQIPINDYAGIAQLVSDDVIEKDTVEFGAGIALSDLTISWGEYVPHADPESSGSGLDAPGWMDAGSVHTTMDISWANGSGIRVLMPHASPMDNGIDPAVLDYAPNLDMSRFDWFLGTGLEQFRFADGTVLSMQEMIALAPPPLTLDPHELNNLLDGTATADMLIGAQGDDVIRGGAGNDVYVFNPGDGVDTIEDTRSSGDFNVIRFGEGIAPGDLNILWTTDGLTLEVGTGGDAIVLVNPDSNSSDPSLVIDELVFTVVGEEGGEAETVNIPLANLLPPPPADDSGARITGTAANDMLVGTAGDDTIDGLAGKDAVYAGDGDDTIIGGAGRDRLFGAGGDDIFLIEGADHAYDRFNGGAGFDTILGGDGDDIVRLRKFGRANSVERIDGGSGANAIAGTHASDRIDLGATEVRNIDFIHAGAGNDRVRGTSGDDVIIGGRGRDRLNGGAGNDRYLFSRGAGRDVVADSEPGPNSDRIDFGPAIHHDQLWFRQVGEDLAVQVVGTRDRIIIDNWYLGADHQVETFHAGDGWTLLNTQVDQLVQAMAAFSPPASGELDLSPELLNQLELVLAANWQSA